MRRFDTIFSEAQCVSSELKYIYIYSLFKQRPHLDFEKTNWVGKASCVFLD